MSDIAFLLLIFFMVTTAFAARKGIDFRLPKDSDEQQNQEDVIVKAITIVVQPSGRILIDTIPKNPSDIQPYIKPRIAADPNKPVIIQVDENATYGDMMAVMDEVKASEVRNIALPSREEMKSW